MVRNNLELCNCQYYIIKRFWAMRRLKSTGVSMSGLKGIYIKQVGSILEFAVPSPDLFLKKDDSSEDCHAYHTS